MNTQHDTNTATEQALRFLDLYTRDSVRNNTALVQEFEPIKVKALAVLSSQFTLPKVQS